MVSLLYLDRPEGTDGQEAGVSAALLKLADAHGLYSGVYMHFGHARGGPVRTIASTPVARRQYAELLAASQVVSQAQVSHRPFAWSSKEGASAFPASQGHAGIAVPVQDHVNGPGLVALIGIDTDRVKALVRDEGPSLSWSATDIHMAALAAVRAQQSPSPTAREMDCLRMAAEGLTAAAIGASLGIAVRTVEFHLRNVCEKLGATSKVNAVAIAASRGLLRCDPAPLHEAG